jgi:spermidine synthase
MIAHKGIRKAPFLTGVFLITLSTLMFQIVQTRILSVMAWYYMAFFAISVAMLGMTVGAVWVYLRHEQFEAVPLPQTLSDYSLLAAIAMPASAAVQYSLITTLSLSLTTVFSWSLMLAAMALPYVFAGVVVSLALTRSPFPAGSVYGCDLVGAALGCLAVIGVLNFVDGPTAIIVAGAVCAISAVAFTASLPADAREGNARPSQRKPVIVAVCLVLLALFNAKSSLRFRPILVKNQFELRQESGGFEKWNSYSRIKVTAPQVLKPMLWGPSLNMPDNWNVAQSLMNIDGAAGTWMIHYDGTPDSIGFLQYDLVSLAYRLPGIHKSAVIGVGGGRDVLTAHYFGVSDITGVELNPILVHLHTTDPRFKTFSNLMLLPNLKLHVDDARSWFASTHEKFDLVQMSMIDTWAATGAGAFSLSENGLYTLEGWRAFLHTLNDNGIFTVSRWYGPQNINETGRMIGLGTAALLDAGVKDPRQHIFVATSTRIATLVLSKSAFTQQQLDILNSTAQKLGFDVLISPDRTSSSPLLQQAVESTDLTSLNRDLGASYLDLTVPTDRRPFFFNQLRMFNIRDLMTIYRLHAAHQLGGGVLKGNLVASAVLMLILFLSIIAVIATILFPLRSAIRACPRTLVFKGSLYFSLIGMGFMLAEIASLEYFSVYLGHPIYSLGICLFSLILASGIGSLASERWRIDSRGRLMVWAGILAAYLVNMNLALPAIFQSTTGQERTVRIAVTLAAILPMGFLFGFAFPTGIRLVSAIDEGPTPWFWGINGATGVLASVLGVIISIAFGIDVSIYLSAICYLALIPVGLALLKSGASLGVPGGKNLSGVEALTGK